MELEQLFNNLLNFNVDLMENNIEVFNNDEMVEVLEEYATKYEIHVERFFDAMYLQPREDFVKDKNLVIKDGSNQLYNFAYPASISKEFDTLSNPGKNVNFNFSLLTPSQVYTFLYLLNPHPNEKICELRTNEGYFTGLLSRLSKEVVSVQPNYQVDGLAKKNLKKYGQEIKNVKILEKEESYDLMFSKNYSNLFDKVVACGSLLSEDESELTHLINSNGKIVAPYYNFNTNFSDLFLYKNTSFKLYKFEVFDSMFFPPFISQ